MFLKMKSRVLRILVCAAAGALCLYSGAACAAALYKAHGQPYLLAGTERFDFMGYYMVAAPMGHGLRPAGRVPCPFYQTVPKDGDLTFPPPSHTISEPDHTKEKE